MKYLTLLLCSVFLLSSCQKDECLDEPLFVFENVFGEDGHIFVTDADGKMIASQEKLEGNQKIKLFCDKKHNADRFDITYIYHSQGFLGRGEILSVKKYIGLKPGSYLNGFPTSLSSNNLLTAFPINNRINTYVQWTGNTTDIEYYFFSTDIRAIGFTQNLSEIKQYKKSIGTPHFIGVKYFGENTIHVGLVSPPEDEFTNDPILINESNLTHNLPLLENSTENAPSYSKQVYGTAACGENNSFSHRTENIFVNIEEAFPDSVDMNIELNFSSEDLFSRYITKLFFTNNIFDLSEIFAPSNDTHKNISYHAEGFVPDDFILDTPDFQANLDSDGKLELTDTSSEIFYILNINHNTGENPVSLQVHGNMEDILEYEVPEKLPKEFRNLYPNYKSSDWDISGISRFELPKLSTKQDYYDFHLNNNIGLDESDCQLFELGGEFYKKNYQSLGN
jgi:hypothetical protein